MHQSNYQLKLGVDLENEESRRKIITQMSQLRKNPAWKIVCKHLDALIDGLKSDIFQTGMNEVKYSEKDLMILHHNFIKMFLVIPETFIEALTANEEGALIEDNDPY